MPWKCLGELLALVKKSLSQSTTLVQTEVSKQLLDTLHLLGYSEAASKLNM